MIKRLTILSCFLWMGTLLIRSQVLPPWVLKMPIPGNDTYLYTVESAVGTTELEARNQAIGRVFQTMALRLGMPIDSRALNDAVQRGDVLDFIPTTYNLPINKVCEYTERITNGIFRSYVLCQVARAGNIAPRWEVFTDCLAEQFIQRQQRKRKANRIGHLFNDDDCYIAWGIISTGYPWRFGTTFNGRYGGILGIGCYFNLGIDIMAPSILKPSQPPTLDETWYPIDKFDYERSVHYTPFHYAVGVKLFPYKRLYLSCGYGTIGGINQYYDKVHRYSYDYSTYEQHFYYKRQIQNTGLILNVGYDLLTSWVDNAAFFMSFNAGASYDIANKTWYPSIGVQLGVGFKVEDKNK